VRLSKGLKNCFEKCETFQNIENDCWVWQKGKKNLQMKPAADQQSAKREE